MSSSGLRPDFRVLSNSYIKKTVRAVRDHSGVSCAAITGSFAREHGGDQHSDLDLLLVSGQEDVVRDVRSWLPEPERIVIAAVHLVHYYSVLMDDLFKVDLAIYSIDDTASDWVVQDFEVIKGGPDFEEQLKSAKRTTGRNRGAHLNPDVSMDDVLLLSTAAKRSVRGEDLSAHMWVSMASDMLICLELQQSSVPSGTDLLDPRRRLEISKPSLGQTLREALFVPPEKGIKRLAEYVLKSRGAMQPAQEKVAERLSRL